MAGEGCWEALPSVLKLEDLLSPSWRKFETSFERERQSRYKKYITHCRHVHRLIVHGLLRCCGFFPLQCRVDSFHSATQCCPFCFTILWSLSASELCGFFPLGGSSSSSVSLSSSSSSSSRASLVMYRLMHAGSEADSWRFSACGLYGQSQGIDTPACTPDHAMSDAGPHASGDVFNRNVVRCSGDGIRGTQASATSAQQQRVVVLTDMVSPPPSSIAGADLATNLMKFKQSGVTVALHEWCQSVLQWWAPWMKDAEETPASYNKKNRPWWFSAEVTSYRGYGDIKYAGQVTRDHQYNVY